MTEQNTSNSAEMDPDAGLRDQLADAFMAEAAFDGWTRAALTAGGRALDLPAGEADRLFPGGPLQALAYVSERADRRTVEDMEKEGIPALKIRDRITRAVRIRLERHAGSREAARRALSTLSLPFNAGLALKLLYKTVDAMWYAAGDTSTDFNFYTKRATLAGVYSSTLLYWLSDRSPGAEATWAFLDRRIEDVMKFEKLKGQVRSWTGPKRPGARPAARPSARR
jgi:ubiquinone biosynthesis protein COQ9